MGNVSMSCCRSKSPRLDSNSSRAKGDYDAQSDDEHDPSARRKLSSRLTKGEVSKDSAFEQSRSLQTSSQNILQHISEREPDDSETDPSSNPLDRPIFATRSSCSKSHHCKLSASSSTSNYNDSYNSNLSSSIAKKQIHSNTPLTSSQDQGYNSSASTNLTHFDGSLLTAATTSISFAVDTKVRDDQQQRIVDKINEQIHGLSSPTGNSTGQNSTISPSGSLIKSNQDIEDQQQDNKIDPMQTIFSRRKYCEDRLKASSCSTIFVDNSTISQPNLEQTIKCVSLAIYLHIRDRTSDETVQIFDESIHPLKMPSSVSEHSSDQQGSLIRDESNILLETSNKGRSSGDETGEAGKKMTIDDDEDDADEPDQETIHIFVKTLFKSAQLTSEYAITTLVYLERLMTYAEIDLTPKSWRRMFLGAILLSSKVWEDQAVWNVDYAQILEEISVDDINELERQFLELIQFNMNVPSSVYAKYYFHLRTLALQNGLTDEQIILTTGQARELEAMSRVRAVSGEYLSSTIERKVDGKPIKKHTSFEKLMLSGRARAVLM